MDAWPASSGEALHTSTFLGNPLGCAMAVASLKIHAAPEVARQVREKGAKLKSALQAIVSPAIGHVRGAGLMIGVELVEPGTRTGAAEIRSQTSPAGGFAEDTLLPVDFGPRPATELAISLVKRALHAGIILLADSPAGNVLSFTPPFCISDEEIGFVAGWLEQALTCPTIVGSGPGKPLTTA
jgi:4-aminobutyrate aminotransferase-like enzyme